MAESSGSDIYIFDTESSISISNSYFNNMYGSSIYAQSASISIISSTIENNYYEKNSLEDYGGGLFCGNCEEIYLNNSIFRNLSA